MQNRHKCNCFLILKYVKIVFVLKHFMANLRLFMSIFKIKYFTFSLERFFDDKRVSKNVLSNILDHQFGIK